MHDVILPLHRAAESNENPAIFEALLFDAGADLKAREKDVLTRLQVAAGLNKSPDYYSQIFMDVRADLEATGHTMSEHGTA